ncbi:MAG: hypothetical protein V4525_12910 [Pseudomonadota bacterium]
MLDEKCGCNFRNTIGAWGREIKLGDKQRETALPPYPNLALSLERRRHVITFTFIVVFNNEGFNYNDALL